MLFTGNRAERGLLEPVFKAIADAGMAPIWAELKEELRPNSNFQAGAAFAQWKTLDGPPYPDLCIVPCDREEMVGVALYLFFKNIPFAQFHGGDIGSGTHDEIGRWIISRCASLHFCNSPESAQNLIKSGEEAWRVHTVGSTAFDNIEPDESTIPRGMFNLVLIHPDTFSLEQTQKDLDETLQAIGSETLAVILGPNRDTNWELVDRTWRIRRDVGHANINYMPKGVPRPVFLGLMKNCRRFITNSSSALYELPAFDIRKYVPVGKRNAARKPLEKIEPGGSARIARILKDVEIDDRLLRKKFLW